MNKDYEIGYGKPPEQHRFKPGESGNRRGRPRGSKNTYTLLNEILDQKILLKENGQTVKLSKREAMLIQLVNKGVKGDSKALAVLFPHLLAVDLKEEERENVMRTLHTDDQAIITSFLENCAGITPAEDDDEEQNGSTPEPES